MTWVRAEVSLGLPGSSLRCNWQSKYSYMRSNFSLSVFRDYMMHPTHIVCPRIVRVAVPRLINLLKFWRSITRDSLGKARVVYIYATRYACVRRSLTTKRAKNTGFLHFLTQPVRILTIYRLEPSSGFSLPFLCISRRLDQNWGSLLQTLPHTHTITQITVRYVYF